MSGDSSFTAPLPTALAWCATQPRFLSAAGDTLVWATGEYDEPGGLFEVRAADLGRVAPTCLLDFAPWRATGAACPQGLAVYGEHAVVVMPGGLVSVPLGGGPHTTMRRGANDAAMIYGIGTWRGDLYISTYEALVPSRGAAGAIRWTIERARGATFERTHVGIEPPRGEDALLIDGPVSPPWDLRDSTGAFFSDGDGRVVRVTLDDLRLDEPTGFSPHHAQHLGDGVVMSNRTGAVVYADPVRGVRHWTVRDEQGLDLVADVLCIAANRAVLRCRARRTVEDHRLCALDLSNGTLVTLFQTESHITSAVACDGRVIWATADGALGAISSGELATRRAARSLSPDPWHEVPDLEEDPRPPAWRRETPSPEELEPALLTAYGAAPASAPVIAPWVSWTLLALGRYRRLMLGLMPHLPPVLSGEHQRLKGLRGYAVGGAWAATVSAPGRTNEPVLFRAVPTALGGWVVDASVVHAWSFARWVERRTGPVEERVWRWLPGHDLLVHQLQHWVERAGGRQHDEWLSLGPLLEDTFRDHGAALDAPTYDTFVRVAAALGDDEVHAPTSARCTATTTRHAAVIDSLLDDDQACVVGALPHLRSAPALVAACDRLIIAHRRRGGRALPPGVAELLTRAAPTSPALHLLFRKATPRRWPDAHVVSAAEYLVQRGLERDAVRAWLRRLAGWDLVGLPARARRHSAPSRELILLALALEPDAAPVFLAHALRSPLEHAVTRAADVLVAIDAPWCRDLLRSAQHTAEHRRHLEQALAYLCTAPDERPEWPRAWQLALLHEELGDLDASLARLRGDAATARGN